MDDLISRQEALDAVFNNAEHPDKAYEAIRHLPSAQPERLTDDDFETIRIHLSAYKERLCNQHRWKEAEEYQRIIDRFTAFASAQPDVPDTNVGDTISRQAAINVLEERLRANGYSNVALVSELNRSIGYLMRLPSAERHGRWEKHLR